MDKGGKVFNVCDEFLLHSYKSHLIATICTELHVETPEAPITREATLQWLETTADMVVANTEYPLTSSNPDTIHTLHCCFLHTAFLYSNLWQAILFEEGPQVIRHWKWWIPRFLVTNYAN